MTDPADGSGADGVSLYVYGLVESEVAEAVISADPSRRLVPVAPGRVAAVCEPLSPDAVAAATEDDDQLAQLARRHDSVVRFLATCGPALPVRMGTMCSPDKLAAGLVEAEDEIVDQLARLRNRHEWRLRVEHDTAAEAPPRRPSRAESGTDYLLRRRTELSAGLAAGPDDAFAAADAVLCTFSAEAGTVRRFGRTSRSRSYLVADGVVDNLLATLGPVLDGATTRGAKLVLTGPLPAYSFADVRLGAGAPAGAAP